MTEVQKLRRSNRLTERAIWEDQAALFETDEAVLNNFSVIKSKDKQNRLISLRRIAKFNEYGFRRLNKLTSFEPFSIAPYLILFEPPLKIDDFAIPSAWKPAERIMRSYRPLIANYFKAPLQRITSSPEDVPQCGCLIEEGCGSQCVNRQLFMECGLGYCKACTHDSTTRNNTAIQQGIFPSVEVFKTADRGYGLRLMEDVLPDTIIVEYLGEVITQKECIERMIQYKSADDFYFASLGNGLMLDAKKMGSVARFANHSCMPNTDLQKWNVLGEDRIVLVSNRYIVAGTEITYNYQYFDDGLDLNKKMKRQSCFCGFPSCSGTIGGRVVVSEFEKWREKIEALMSGTKKHSLAIFIEQKKFADEKFDESELAQPVNRAVYGQLDRMIQDCISLQEDIHRLFQSKVLVTTAVVNALVSKIPSCVKCDIMVSLQTAVDKRDNVERSLCMILQSASEKPASFPGSSATDTTSEEEGSDLTNLDVIGEDCNAEGNKGKDIVDDWYSGDRTNSVDGEEQAQDQVVEGVKSKIHKRERTEDVDEGNGLLAGTELGNESSAPLYEAHGRAISKVDWKEYCSTLISLDDLLPLECIGATEFLEYFRICCAWASKWSCFAVASPTSRGATIGPSSPFYDHWVGVERLARVYNVAVSKELLYGASLIERRMERYEKRCSLDLLEKNAWLPMRIKKRVELVKDDDRCEADIASDGDGHGLTGIETNMKGASEGSNSDTEVVLDNSSIQSEVVRRSSTGRAIRPRRLMEDEVETPQRNLSKRLSKGRHAQYEETDEKSDDGDDGNEKKDEELLVCVCRMPERLGEVTTLVQCETCATWFHPQCLNLLPEHVSAGSNFDCPFCLHNSNIPNAYSYAPRPRAEWDLMGAHSVERHSSAGKDHLGVQSSSSLQMPSFEDLQLALRESHELPISQNPFAIQLKRVFDAIESWENRVDNFLKDEETQKILNPDATGVILVRCSPLVLDAERVLLFKLIRFYLDLRVLRVTSPKLSTVRRALWSLSARTVLRHVELDGASDSDLDDFSYRPNMEIFRAVMEGGKSLGLKPCDGSSVVYSTLVQRHDRIIYILASGLRCSISDSSIIFSDLQTVLGPVLLEHNYSYVRLKCLSSHTSLEHIPIPQDLRSHEMKITLPEDSLLAGSPNQMETSDYMRLCPVCDIDDSKMKMVSCSQCRRWYHIECVTDPYNLKRKKQSPARLRREEYVCLVCTELSGQRYIFEWSNNEIANLKPPLLSDKPRMTSAHRETLLKKRKRRKLDCSPVEKNDE